MRLSRLHRRRLSYTGNCTVITKSSILDRKSPRPISTVRLNMLPYLHLLPINHVICVGTYLITQWENSSHGGLRTYMLSALIRFEHSYSAFTLGRITDTLEVRSSRSSRTKEDSVQFSCAYTGYGPNCLTTFWTQLACRFNGRTAQPLGPTTAPGCDEPTSRCQTSPSMWTLGGDKPVIPMVTFIRWAMALPFGTTGSLYPTFVPARLVGLAVKLPCAITLNGWFPTNLREPLNASVTL